jgi:tetratricopeptide (TPR) repeat protein
MKPLKLIIQKIIMLCLIFMICATSCKKQDDWLNVKNIKSDVTPKTLQDLQAVLDNPTVFNSLQSVAGLIASDNIYLPDAKLDAASQVDRNTYLWAKDIYQGSTANDWFNNYQEVVYSNIVLEGVANLSAQNEPVITNNIKGEALFFRSYAFYQLCQLYCKPYIKVSAGSDLGIPIRTSSDVNRRVQRSTVQESYDQMIGDLKLALILLPVNAAFNSRPNIAAANALLAKIYLSMGDYTNAFKFADAALKINNSLLDFNSLKITASDPFPSFAKGNPEIILYAYNYGDNVVNLNSSELGRIAPDFYSSYISGDLRKTAFYVQDGTTGLYKAKGSFSDKGGSFAGIANGEIFLIRAEAEIRMGNIQVGLNDLNALLQKRLTPAAYVPYQTTDPTIALTAVLIERRKELAYIGNSRWEDLRRLNQDTKTAITLQRTYHGVSYTLAPADNRYIFPIPTDETTLEGLQQNQR